MQHNHRRSFSFLRNWRYWPMELLYLPLTLYILFVESFRTGKLFYFAAANPEVSLGGFAGDSKSAILDKVPRDYRPETLLITRQENDLIALERYITTWFTFPLIVKPDIGEGGFLVRRLQTIAEWEAYHREHDMDYIVQEYVGLPLEVSILVYKKDGIFQTSAVTEKRYFTLTGDGTSTVSELLEQQPLTGKGKKQLRRLLHNQFYHVLPAGAVFQPATIGNWNYGATFFHRPDWNTEALTRVMEQLNQETGLFRYARYDIKCADFSALENGRFLVLEINGVKGEPIHIYDPKNTLWNAYCEIFRHWRIIGKISRQQLQAGVPCPTIREGFGILRRHRKTLKSSLKPRINHEQAPVFTR